MLQFIKLTFIYIQIILVVLYMPYVWNYYRKRNAKISMDFSVLPSNGICQKYHNFDEIRQIHISHAYI